MKLWIQALLLVQLASVQLQVEGKCVYGKWTPWTPCSEPCSGGKQSRYRQGTGDTCEPNFVERPCNTQTCTPPTLDPFDSHMDFLPFAGTQKLFLSGISTGGDPDQTLSVDAMSSNTTVIDNLRVRYRSPETTGEVAFNVKQAGEAHIRVSVVDSGSTHKGPQFGGSQIKVVVKASKVLCQQNEYVQGGRCKPCDPGTFHDAGADTSGADTSCRIEMCKENERVLNNRCVPCLPGEQHNHGGDPSKEATRCEPILCQENEHVQSNKCVRCPAGYSRPAGDPANSYNTYCDPANCKQNEYLFQNECVPCPKGQTSVGGQAIGCEEIVCQEGERVKDSICTICPAGHSHPEGAVASGPDTHCEVTECRENESFDGEICVSCPPGHEHPGRSSIFDDEDCTMTICGPNQEHDGTTCRQCPPGHTSGGGHTLGDDDSDCEEIVCGANEGVKDNVCVKCPPGHAADGHSAGGADAHCEIVVCPPGHKMVDAGCVACPPGHTHVDGEEDECAAAVKAVCGEADIMFVMDMSGSIGGANFTVMKEAVKSIASALQIAPDGAHAAVVTFATTAASESDFDEGNELREFHRSIDGLQYGPGKDTYIDRGLDLATKVLAAHSEAETPKILIIMTDGRQTGGGAAARQVLPAAVAPLRQFGVKVIAIGIGEEVDPRQLALLVEHEHELILTGFNRLAEQVEELAILACGNLEIHTAGDSAHGPGGDHGGGGAPVRPGGANRPNRPQQPPSDGGQCASYNGAQQCRGNGCDWCFFRSICAPKGQCPGARRSTDLPPLESLATCACTDSGVKYSDMTNEHFCWMREFPCKGREDEIVLRQWADCSQVDCPVSPHKIVGAEGIDYPAYMGHGTKDGHTHGVDNNPHLDVCFDIPFRQRCRKQQGCRWCPGFKACAPEGQCKALSKRQKAAAAAQPAESESPEEQQVVEVEESPEEQQQQVGKAEAQAARKKRVKKRRKVVRTPRPTAEPTQEPTAEPTQEPTTAEEEATAAEVVEYETYYVYESDDYELSYLDEEAPVPATAEEVSEEDEDCQQRGNRVYCDDGKVFEVDANGFRWEVDPEDTQKQRTPERPNFKDMLTSLMVRRVGEEKDPDTGKHCLSARDLCAVAGQEYCCDWQQRLVTFYRELNNDLGAANDPTTGKHCLSIEDACQTGQQYCCNWLNGLVELFEGN